MIVNHETTASLSNSKVETQIGDHRNGILFPNQQQSSQLVWHKPMIFKDFRGLRGFGYSLSGNVDLDGNGYPDFLVGAPFSGQTVYFR